MDTKWRKWAKIAILGAVALAAAGTFAGCGGAPKKPVKAETIIADYERNIRDGEKRYKDKKIRVTGQVINKYQFSNTADYGIPIAYDAKYPKDYVVVLDVPADKTQLVNSVKVSDFVDAVGTCVGVVPQDNPNIVSIQIQVENIH